MKVVNGQLKARTLGEYGRLLDCYVLPELGQVPIAAVTPAQLEQLIRELATDGKRRGGGDLHPRTVKHAWHVTRQVFRYAMRHDALAANPIDRVDYSANRATGDRDNFEPHPLTAEQIADGCAALCGERPGRDGKPLPALPVYALMVEFAAYTGLRASELAGLEIADLVFALVPVGAQPKCSVRVERTKTKGKRAGEGWIVGTPKSKRSRRTVPLPGWLAAKMADYLTYVHPRAAGPDAPLWPAHASRAARAGQPASEWLTELEWSEPVELGTFYRYAFARALQAGWAAGDDTGSRRQASVARRAAARPTPQRRRGVVASRCPCGAGIALARPRATDDHAQRIWRLGSGNCREPAAGAGGAECRCAVAAPRQRLSCNVDNE